MKKVLLIGGTGGLGRKISEKLSLKLDCESVGSKVFNVCDEYVVREYLERNDYDIIVYLSVKNIDGQIHKQTTESVNLQLDVNVNGFLNVLRYSTPKLREKGYGRIIYISSVLAKKPIRGTGIYSASKTFCESIIKTYSLENSKYGITANSIRLGYFDGGLTEKVPNEIMENVVNTIPLKRLGAADEIAAIIQTIIETEYINGATISITGGYENI